jgi:hypothetical protein
MLPEIIPSISKLDADREAAIERALAGARRGRTGERVVASLPTLGRKA